MGRDGSGTERPSAEARRIAAFAADSLLHDAIRTLSDLVAFRTVNEPGVENAAHPEFRAMTAYLEERARALGLDFEDHGAAVVIGLGDTSDRLGLVTHGDVQPADSTKWARDPFSLDVVSEPGLLIGRGVEDDKGPIAAALYAMKALLDHDVPLRRRIELIVSYTEESDWTPFQEFLERRPPPDLNVALDSEYPVVTAEKGWNMVYLRVPAGRPELAGSSETPRLVRFEGGSFIAQVPEDARAVIAHPSPALVEVLRERATTDSATAFRFVEDSDSLIITAEGRSAHSAKPWEGVNAIAHLARLLGDLEWPATQSAVMVRLVNDLIGTEAYAQRFGEVAFTHDFMGPLTLALTTLSPEADGSLVAAVNIRSPVGRSGAELEQRVDDAVALWGESTGLEVSHSVFTSPPHYLERAPHISVLLDVFEHYTGTENPQPIATGGGTHARLVPNGVNFGPAMPGEPYTGHSEHEYVTRAQYRLSLEMYTAMLVELSGAEVRTPDPG